MEQEHYLIKITDNFPKRGHESVYTFRGTLQDEYGTNFPVLIKSPDVPVSSIPEGFNAVQYYNHIWQQLQKAGINVVPWLIEHENGVIVPDMEYDNYRFYGKSRSLAINNNHLNLPPFCYQDFLFLLVFSEETVELNRRLSELVFTATENGIGLPYDDPAELIIHPDGYFDLITLDLSRTKLDITMDEAYSINQLATTRLYRHWQVVYDFYREIFEYNPSVFDR